MHIIAAQGRRGYRPRAFTLIEAAVTMIVMATLALVATFTGNGILNGSNDHSAQHNLTIVAAEAESYYSNNQAFPTCTISDCSAMTSLEPSLTYVYGATSSGASTTSKQLSVYVNTSSSPQTFTVAARSQSGTCFLLTITPPNSSIADVRTSSPSNVACYAGSGPGSGASW